MSRDPVFFKLLTISKPYRLNARNTTVEWERQGRRIQEQPLIMVTCSTDRLSIPCLWVTRCNVSILRKMDQYILFNNQLLPWKDSPSPWIMSSPWLWNKIVNYILCANSRSNWKMKCFFSEFLRMYWRFVSNISNSEKDTQAENRNPRSLIGRIAKCLTYIWNSL